MYIKKSPSGALSPYYYKGGYFHGMHFGSYVDDMTALFAMMTKEEEFIMKSPEKRRIMIEFFQTNLTSEMLVSFADFIERLNSRIIKIAVSADKKMLKAIQKALGNTSLGYGQMYFTPDMEEGKTWLVGESQ